MGYLFRSRPTEGRQTDCCLAGCMAATGARAWATVFGKAHGSREGVPPYRRGGLPPPPSLQDKSHAPPPPWSAVSWPPAIPTSHGQSVLRQKAHIAYACASGAAREAEAVVRQQIGGVGSYSLTDNHA